MSLMNEGVPLKSPSEPICESVGEAGEEKVGRIDDRLLPLNLRKTAENGKRVTWVMSRAQRACRSWIIVDRNVSEAKGKGGRIGRRRRGREWGEGLRR